MNHPFIIKLLGTTQDENNLYFVFENCEHGDLTGLISERSKLKRLLDRVDIKFHSPFPLVIRSKRNYRDVDAVFFFREARHQTS
jgi:serine/threonine protein kinase